MNFPQKLNSEHLGQACCDVSKKVTAEEKNTDGRWDLFYLFSCPATTHMHAGHATLFFHSDFMPT
jgi:hypothetical protein